MKVTTGFGYIVKDGKIVDKYELPIGEHPLKDGYSQVEVQDGKELESIEVYIEPKSQVELDSIALDALIRAKHKELAIEALKKDGKLDQDGKLSK